MPYLVYLSLLLSLVACASREEGPATISLREDGVLVLGEWADFHVGLGTSEPPVRAVSSDPDVVSVEFAYADTEDMWTYALFATGVGTAQIEITTDRMSFVRQIEVVDEPGGWAFTTGPYGAEERLDSVDVRRGGELRLFAHRQCGERSCIGNTYRESIEFEVPTDRSGVFNGISTSGLEVRVHERADAAELVEFQPRYGLPGVLLESVVEGRPLFGVEASFTLDGEELPGRGVSVSFPDGEQERELTAFFDGEVLTTIIRTDEDADDLYVSSERSHLYFNAR